MASSSIPSTSQTPFIHVSPSAWALVSCHSPAPAFRHASAPRLPPRLWRLLQQHRLARAAGQSCSLKAVGRSAVECGWAGELHADGAAVSSSEKRAWPAGCAASGMGWPCMSEAGSWRSRGRV
eukprot:731516-Rhodomonas_salina.2